LTRDAALKSDLLRRLRTASGHLIGVVRMIDDEAYCVDILKQIAAVQSFIRLIEGGAGASSCTSHMNAVVRGGPVLADWGEARIDELMETLRYLRYF